MLLIRERGCQTVIDFYILVCYNFNGVLFFFKLIALDSILLLGGFMSEERIKRIFLLVGIFDAVIGITTAILGLIAGQYSGDASGACYFGAYVLLFSAAFFVFPTIGGPLYEKIKNLIIRDSEINNRNSGLGALALLLLFLSFVGTISGIVGSTTAISVFNHVDTVTVSNTKIVSRGFEEDRSYIDPVARIHFTADLQVEEYEVGLVYMHFLVYENDQFIGYFKCDFAGNETRKETNGVSVSTSNYFRPETTHSLSFQLQESSVKYTKDPIFYRMFTGDLDTITIVPKVIYTSFVDGPSMGDFDDYMYGYYDANGEFQNDFNG